MNIALLFNSDELSNKSNYAFAIMEDILKTNVLQTSSRHMRISVGDVLTFSAVTNNNSKNYISLYEICKETYRPIEFDYLKKEELYNSFYNSTIFCWVFQNITNEIGLNLHNSLKKIDYYLGAMDVVFDYIPHLQFFRNSLCEVYGIYEKQVHIFYNLSNNEDPIFEEKVLFEKYGFLVSYEDIGARRTIFDNYYNIEHFIRVEDIKKIFSKMNSLNDSLISDIVFFLEELHPKLFDVLASAARTFDRAETEEDFAQVAISGRRLMQKFADFVFPPRKEKYNHRDVGHDKYKNRIWAYIEDTINDYEIEDKDLLEKLGKEADNLWFLFCDGLHANPNRESIEKAFSELIIWLYKVIELSPEAIKRPYLAYEDNL